MQITFISVKPNKKSFEKELIFTYSVSEITEEEIPISFSGELYTEDGLKIGNLYDSIGSKNRYDLHLSALDRPNKSKKNRDFELEFSCNLSDKAISHIESYRLNEKDKTKDVSFQVKLEVVSQSTNITLAHLHVGNQDILLGKDAHTVYYKYVNHFSPLRTNMWVLSGESSPNLFIHKRYHYPLPNVTIDLMKWVNYFTDYLGIGKFLVLEFIQPDTTVFSKKIANRYNKAQGALKEMQELFGSGKWKQAIIASRPIFELFKNFDDFKQLLIDSGYTEPAYLELKKSIDGCFGLLSKLHHGLEKNRKDVNPDIPVHMEDTYYIYSFSVSLMHMISQKIKRKLS